MKQRTRNCAYLRRWHRFALLFVPLLAVACGRSTPKTSEGAVGAAKQSEANEVESVCGWDMLAPSVTLTGIVMRISYADGPDGDDDWSIFVQPDPNYAHLLINRDGQVNQDGLVECEVQPPDRVNGVDFNRPATMASYFQPLLGKRVTVVGTHVQEAWFCHDNKTEIHPIVSIFQTDGPQPLGVAYKMKFFVFSDSASLQLIPPIRPVLPFYNRFNNLASFRVPFPAPLPDVDPDGMHQFTVLREVNAARSREFLITPDDPNYLTGRFQSGISDEGKGFYFAEIEIGPPAAFVSQSVPTAMNAGQAYDVSITLRNLSPSAWWPQDSQNRLGSQNPQDNMTWGLARVELPSFVLPQGLAVFGFRVTAPPNNGLYNFQWRMLEENVRWFGQFTPNVQINVSGGAPPSCSDSQLCGNYPNCYDCSCDPCHGHVCCSPDICTPSGCQDCAGHACGP